jgi:hypothetical protein
VPISFISPFNVSRIPYIHPVCKSYDVLTHDSEDFDEIVRITLQKQESKTTFTAFKRVLIGASDWFRNALSGRWAENNDGTVEVRDHDAQTFQWLLNYANTGRPFDKMPDLDVNFRSDCAEGSWPIKLSGSEDEAQRMG